MLKRLEVVVLNLMIFWIVASTMPGIESPHGAFGFFLGGIFYGLLILSLPEILRFFRFPKNVWGKLLIGSGFTFVLMFLISAFLPQVISISSGYVGGVDFIWFSVPRLLDLPSMYAVAGFVSVLLNLCSIILQFLNKGRV